MEEVTVSIIIPVFDASNYIEKCVLSCVHQSYRSIEIVLIDDGSSDDSLSVCQKLSATFENVALISHDKNYGQEKTRTDGLAAAKGEWVLFLDSDDTLENSCVEKLLSAALETKSDIVVFDFDYITNNLRSRVSASIDQKKYTSKEFIQHFLSDVSWSFISCIGTKLYNLPFLRKNNLFFEKQYKYNEDGAFALKAIEKATSIYYLKESFYNYLIRDSGSTQSSYRKDMFCTIKNVHQLLRDILNANNCSSNVWSLFYLQCVQFIYVCLKNEKTFKDYSSFKSTFYYIRNDVAYSELYKYARSIKPLKYKFFLFLFRLKWVRALYFIS